MWLNAVLQKPRVQPEATAAGPRDIAACTIQLPGSLRPGGSVAVTLNTKGIQREVCEMEHHREVNCIFRECLESVMPPDISGLLLLPGLTQDPCSHTVS